ncbi:uroporphyrinogen decarboxylase family protein [Victivallis lenta]|uniref:uroporphyrinogen decarboxylase family protein n=1 Tax=Victivallis lenta TaxID=2606640 RepID=UPI002354DFB4|nr:uroporphyrinogen decarboxylase family protein [Victivallis lenta]
MQLNMKEFVETVLASPRRYVMPIMTSPGMELIGAKPVDVFRDGELQFRCIDALAKATPCDAAVTFMDLSVEAEAFGSPIRYSEHENPTVTDRIVADRNEIDALAVPEVGAARTAEVLKCAKLCAANLDRPVFGGMIGPFSLAGRLADMTEIMIMAAVEPEAAHALLDKTASFLAGYAEAIKATGVNGIVIAEPAAGLLSPDMCRDFAADYVRRIVERVQDDNFMVILHNCGRTEQQIPALLSTGAMALHLGNAVSIPEILPQMPEKTLLMGNIDPVGMFKNATPEEIYRKTAELLEATKEYRNFVLSSGCDVPPGVSMENIRAFYRAAADRSRA